ncbi:GntR family transcriptional regulator [Agromyces sp. SYSU K20354]|uniref:GntR family transcriptional regulator n=1 Tax=Agromyces cavernae TaxID=2898659 RepID=UPI001E3B64CB|nr:GntR family transcriptional regulator [Agromyces cavernae]MCD2442464.1 GntR family transcriptional regulator [Agromyces cavernae]
MHPTKLLEVVSLREQVERALASRIVAGEFAPGAVLTVPTLAAEFGVSATPVREAMLNLARRGFLSPIRNRGFRVTEVSPDELHQLGEVRMLLEAPPMRQIAGRVPDDVAERLHALADEIVQAAREQRFQDYLEADTAFHLSLLELTGNVQLVAVVRELRAQTRLTGLVKVAGTEALAQSSLEHAELLGLLTAGDGAAAEALMRRHIGHVEGIWSGRDEVG